MSELGTMSEPAAKPRRTDATSSAGAEHHQAPGAWGSRYLTIEYQEKYVGSLIEQISHHCEKHHVVTMTMEACRDILSFYINERVRKVQPNMLGVCPADTAECWEGLSPADTAECWEFVWDLVRFMKEEEIVCDSRIFCMMCFAFECHFSFCGKAAFPHDEYYEELTCQYYTFTSPKNNFYVADADAAFIRLTCLVGRIDGALCILYSRRKVYRIGSDN